MKRSLLLLLCMIAFTCQNNAYAWGKLGHEIVIKLAERHLTDKTRENIAKYMPYDLKTDAVWMDQHRRDKGYAYTGRWHGCHVDPITCRYDMDKSAANDDIVRGLAVVEHNLKHYKEMSDSAVLMNIRAIIHLVGDLHCPTHNHYGRREFWKCTLNGKEQKSFHSVYDKMPNLVYGNLSPERIAEQIDNFDKSTIKRVQKGSREDWIYDCASQCKVIYEWNPYDTVELNPQTVELSKDLVERQLQNAGYRLAYLLNLYFGK